MVPLATPDLCANTPGDAIISPENQHQFISDWGYDIKQGGKAAALTPALAQTLFLTDGMTCLRLPIYGDSVKPAHPAGGVVIASYYSDILTAITNARMAKPNVVLFASKKLEGTSSFPAWVKDANGIIPFQYALMLADYLQFMQTNGVTIDVLGIDNETQYNEGNITPDRYTQTIDYLKSFAVTRGFTMPARLIGPEGYSPQSSWVQSLVANGWGNRLDIAGTHYYPDSRPIGSLQSFFSAAGTRPVWNSEVHWDNNSRPDVLSQGEQALATIFDCTDTGLTGFAWWAYERSGVMGGIERNITINTVASRPVDIDDIDGPSANLGTFITRAYRRDTNVFIWALNNTSSNRVSSGFTLDFGTIAGPVSYVQWTTNAESTGNAVATDTNTFRAFLPAGTITVFTMPYRPPTGTAGDIDGDGMSDNFEANAGFDPATANSVFIWTGKASGGDGLSIFQANNWTAFNQPKDVLIVHSDTPITHDLLATSGTLGGGSGFGSDLDLGWRTLSVQGGTLRAQGDAGVTGTRSGRLRLGGRSVAYLKFLDTISAQTTGAPQLTFYTVNAFSNGASLNILSNSSPKIIVQNTTLAAVQNVFLPSLLIANQPANPASFSLSVVNGNDVQIIRQGDLDGDGASDSWEWQNGFDPSDSSDGAQDPDHDGLPNWLESRLGTPPLSLSPPLFLTIERASAANQAVLRLGPGGTNVSYTIWQSLSLAQPWQILQTVNSGQSPLPSYQITLTNPPSASFYRLEVRPSP
jgi:O-glycosyl hydrolase